MNTTVLGLFVLIVISTVLGWLASRRSKTAETPVKVMIFVLYFWGSFFVQLLFLAVLYQFGLLEL